MMENKKVLQALRAETVNMGGIPIKQALPTQKVEQIDPFLLLHHGTFPINKHQKALHQGVGPHPHRGFSPVSFVLNGEVHHRDSLGNSSIISKGGIQWVNSGRGIVHSERPSEQLAISGEPMEVIQLWINVPAKKKMEPASYHAYQKEELPEVDLDAGVKAKVISGILAGIRGKVPAKSEMTIAWIYFDKGSRAELPVDPGHNFALYIPKGSGKIEGYGLAETEHLFNFSKEGEKVVFESKEDAQLIYLSAKPINESLATYGPFVMNNQTEIMEAMRDYQSGKMGILIEE
jgi:redox-sensitive bicupin YhaK (pirin superfamily)